VKELVKTIVEGYLQTPVIQGMTHLFMALHDMDPAEGIHRDREIHGR
jgi:hypothetical protein